MNAQAIISIFAVAAVVAVVLFGFIAEARAKRELAARRAAKIAARQRIATK